MFLNLILCIIHPSHSCLQLIFLAALLEECSLLMSLCSLLPVMFAKSRLGPGPSLSIIHMIHWGKTHLVPSAPDTLPKEHKVEIWCSNLDFIICHILSSPQDLLPSLLRIARLTQELLVRYPVKKHFGSPNV